MKDVVVLCYHAVSETWPSELAVTPERLERQLGRLVRRGYRGATFTDAVTTWPTEPTVVATFDDSYRSVATLAAPILARFGLPGTVFVPTAFISSDEPMCWDGIEEWSNGPWAHELLPMNEEQLRGLAEAGWEIGSHSHTHALLTKLDDGALRRELRESRTICEQVVGKPCSAVAYPYGGCDGRVANAAAEAGYRAAAAMSIGPNRPFRLLWPRVYVARGDGDGQFALKVNRPGRVMRGTSIWRLVGAAREWRERRAKPRPDAT